MNDEPSSIDQLDRNRFAQALTKVATECDSPMVIGLYGTWGVGKTSLMRIIEKQLETTNDCATIWFEAWQHQFDENPSVALLHKMVDELGLGEEGRKLLTVIATALGSVLLKRVTTVSASELRDLEAKFAEERFEIREKQVRLRTYFERLLQRATDDGRIRLVFFIDDLDRCVPEKVLEVLEALKLFLNMPGCVYVLGVDRMALESSIRQRYAGLEISETSYLDKMVQLPFTIPPIPHGSMNAFVQNLVPVSLRSYTSDLIDGIGDNPRQVKRFINTLVLNHELASTMITNNYDPAALVAVLMIQYRSPDLYKEASREPTVLTSLFNSERPELNDRAVMAAARRLQGRTEADIVGYIHLSEVVFARAVSYDVVLVMPGERTVQLTRVIRDFTGLSVAEASDLAKAAPPVTLLTGTSREEANRFVRALAATGSDARVM
ncbi:MAG: ribosomal protein L7/L12 [Acidimicrobiia bacterium]